MTKRSAKALQQMFKHRDDAELKRDFEAIGTHPDHRVKTGPSKGHIKRSFAKYGDDILAEQKRRKAAGPQPAKIVQLSDDGNGEFSIVVIYPNGDVDGHGRTYTARAEAEREAAKAAKAHSCTWEANY